MAVPREHRADFLTVTRRLARALFAVAVLALLALAGLLLASRTATVRELARRRAVVELARLTGADVRIGAVSGSLADTLVVEDLRLAVEGHTVARVPRIEIAFAIAPLLRGEVKLQRVTVSRPRIRAVRTRTGWRLPQRGAAGGRGAGPAIAVERLAVEDGRIAVALLDAEPARRLAATALALEGSVARGTVEVTRLRFVPRGVALSAVDASVRASAEPRGGIRFSGLRVATDRSLLEADGVLAQGIDARARLGPLAARDVRAVLPASRVRADVRARARVRGPWRAIRAFARGELRPGGRISARATFDATAAALGWDARVAVAGVDPGGAVGDLPRGAITGLVRARGAGFDPRGRVAYAALLRDSAIDGRSLERLGLQGWGVRGSHRLRAAVQAPLGEATIRGRVGLATPLTYRAEADWTIARLDLLVPSTSGWATGRLRVHGRGGDPALRDARAGVVLTGAAVQGVPIDRGLVRARLHGQDLAVRTLVLEGREATLRLDGSGRVDLARRTAELHAAGRADLHRLGARLGKPLGGKTTLAVAARGPLAGLAVEVTAAGDGLAYGRLTAGRLTARGDFRGVGGERPGGSLHVDGAMVRLGDGTPHAATGGIEWQRTGREDRAELRLTAFAERGRTHELALTAVRAGASTRGTVERLTLAPPEGPPWRLARAAPFVVDPDVTIDGLVLAAGGQRAALAGRISFRGTSDATITLEQVALGPFCTIGGLPRCDGVLHGRVVLGGTATAPAIELGAEARDVRVADVAYGVLDVDARYADAAARLHASLRHPQAGEVRIEGVVPVDLAWQGRRRDLADAPMSLSAKADRLDMTLLHALAPRTLRSSAGRLTFELTVTGSRAAPRTEGQVAVDGGRIELLAAGVPYENVRARLIAHDTRLELRELHAEAGDGTADVTGTATIGLAEPTTMDLGAHLTEFFAVRREAYEAAVSGDVAIRGALGAPVVTGKLDVVRALVRPAALPAVGPTIPRDPTIRVVGVPEAAAPTAIESDVELARPATVDVTVDIARNAWIRRNDANIEIGGQLHVTKAPAESLRVVGEIRLLRGWFTFQGRRFTIDQGAITFAGASPPKPTFDITAVYPGREYRIEVRITGSGEKPNLVLSSDPPLEEADILSVLLFGKPAHELGRGQSVALQKQALQLAAGYVVPGLRNSVMDVLGLDTLEVELPEGTERTRVSGGRYVAEDVFVSLGQEFGRRAGQVVGVEYSFGRNVSVRASTSTRGDSAVDLFWHYRY